MRQQPMRSGNSARDCDVAARQPLSVLLPLTSRARGSHLSTKPPRGYPVVLRYLFFLCVTLLWIYSFIMSDDSDRESVEVPLLPSKGRHETDWASNKCKKKRNLGEAYVSRSPGRHISARSVGEPCSDGCFDKLTRPVINAIHAQFWAIGDFALQNAYIQKNVTLNPVKRRRAVPDPGAQRRRSVTRSYRLTYESASYSLCKKGFISVLGISDKRMRTALVSVSPSGCPRGDLRGRKPCARRTPAAVTARVKQHIKSFPTVTSHYTRAKSPLMRYLDTTLNIKKMFRMYLLWMEMNYPDEKRVTAGIYRVIFKGFRLGFKPPQSDTCSKCDHFKVALASTTDAEARQKIKDDKKQHLTKAKEGQRVMKRLSKDTNSDTRCICIDLQQTLPVPRLSTSVAYYQKKLWIYNFAIHDLKKNVSQFFVWDEVNGGRGSAEIVSCLLKWIDVEMAKSEFKVLKIVSDNCGGQNKNLNIVLFYMREVHSERLEEVQHYFLVPGHSYMACDRSFGNIEKTIRATGDIYDFRQYCFAIGASRVEKQKVTIMRLGDFVNVDALQDYVTVRRPRPPYKFQDARRFTVTNKFPQGYFLAMEYDGPGGSVRLRKGTAIRNPESFNLYLSLNDLPRKYTSPRRLKPGKVKALKYLINYIPPMHNFYLQYVVSQQEELDEVSDEDEEDADDEGLDYDEDEGGDGGGQAAASATPTTSSQ